MNKQVYSYEQQIVPINQSNKFGKITLSLSKYSDCLFVFINQTGTLGSILQGLVIDSSANLTEEYEFSQQPQNNYIYQIHPLFGSTEITFYQLLLRRIMSIIWQQLKVQHKFRVLLNISLPVLHTSFDQEAYYRQLVQQFKNGLKSVL